MRTSFCMSIRTYNALERLRIGAPIGDLLLNLAICVCIPICVYVHIYICTRFFSYAHKYIHIHMRRVCLFVYIYICMCSFMHLLACIDPFVLAFRTFSPPQAHASLSGMAPCPANCCKLLGASLDLLLTTGLLTPLMVSLTGLLWVTRVVGSVISPVVSS